ncbi:MAG: signal peptidase I [Gammaproteobacteria bacterium]
MKFDLSLILVIFVVLTGGIWLGYRAFGGSFESDRAMTLPAVPRIVEVSRALFPVAVIVLLIRSFLFEPYKIPSPSMMPTLKSGDFIFVNKFAYGLRLPISNAKILETGHPQRGDVAVFRLPSNPTDNYIKRVIGLPNDHIVYRDHRLVVNGEAIEASFGTTLYDQGDAIVGYERLGGDSHEILHSLSAHERSVREFEDTVPDGHYFMMGDNRDNSQDSRSPVVGFVPEDHLVGKAVVVWLNTEDMSRVGDSIR